MLGRSRRVLGASRGRGAGGKLKAQQALAQYYKSLVDEQKRRKLLAP